MMYPDFLGIGVQKGATTWLEENLREHPDIWLPHKKEIDYFVKMGKPLASFPRRVKRMLSSKGFRHDLVIPDLKALRFRDVIWDLRYLLGPFDDKWYSYLFEGGRGKVVGDISPSYSEVDEDVVKHAFEIMPQAKIVFSLRNPIDRAWSHAKMAAKMGNMNFQKFQGRLEEIPLDEYIEFLTLPHIQKRGDYLRTFANWEKYYPRDRWFIFFMEDVVRRPKELLIDFYRYVGVDDSPERVPAKALQKVRPGVSAKIPAEVARFLAEMYLPQIETLAGQFSGHQGEYVAGWLDEARQILAGD